jgi:hypothetical protein
MLAATTCLDAAVCGLTSGDFVSSCVDEIGRDISVSFSCDTSNVTALTVHYPTGDLGPFYALYADGNLVELSLACESCAEPGLEQVYSWTIELVGGAPFPTSATLWYRDQDSQPRIDRTIASLAGDGSILSYRTETIGGAATFVDEREYETLDGQSRLLFRFVDRDGDGERDVSQLFRYGATGEIESIVVLEGSSNTVVLVGNCCGDECRDTPSQVADLTPPTRFR